MEKDGGIKHSMNEHGVIFKSAMSVIAIGTNSVSCESPPLPLYLHNSY